MKFELDSKQLFVFAVIMLLISGATTFVPHVSFLFKSIRILIICASIYTLVLARRQRRREAGIVVAPLARKNKISRIKVVAWEELIAIVNIIAYICLIMFGYGPYGMWFFYGFLGCGLVLIVYGGWAAAALTKSWFE
jgi:hypothetical protein